jgi:hypothetical protein
VKITSESSTKRLKLRRPDRCMQCQRALAAGEEAIWDRAARTVTCIACAGAVAPPITPPLTEGVAGASAMREYQRRHDNREQQARERLGGLGVVLSRVQQEPASTRVWKQGSSGEVRAGERLTKHLREHGVRLLHDRRVPGHGQANIDHVAIGPAGVLVIDTKSHKKKVRTERVGGLFSPRRTLLMVGGRDQTQLIDGVEKQVGYVSAALGRFASETPVTVSGALCFINPDGLPLFSQLRVRDVVIDGPRALAKLARGPGPHEADAIERIWAYLGREFPPA